MENQRQYNWRVEYLCHNKLNDDFHDVTAETVAPDIELALEDVLYYATRDPNHSIFVKKAYVLLPQNDEESDEEEE